MAKKPIITIENGEYVFSSNKKAKLKIYKNRLKIDKRYTTSKGKKKTIKTKMGRTEFCQLLIDVASRLAAKHAVDRYNENQSIIDFIDIQIVAQELNNPFIKENSNGKS